MLFEAQYFRTIHKICQDSLCSEIGDLENTFLIEYMQLYTPNVPYLACNPATLVFSPVNFIQRKRKRILPIFSTLYSKLTARNSMAECFIYFLFNDLILFATPVVPKLRTVQGVCVKSIHLYYMSKLERCILFTQTPCMYTIYFAPTSHKIPFYIE